MISTQAKATEAANSMIDPSYKGTSHPLISGRKLFLIIVPSLHVFWIRALMSARQASPPQ